MAVRIKYNDNTIATVAGGTVSLNTTSKWMNADVVIEVDESPDDGDSLYYGTLVLNTAADIKRALNADIDLTDYVGQQITCTRSNTTLTWDIVDYDNDGVTLLLHDQFGTALSFEPQQALAYFEEGLAAGDYTFVWNATQVYFTLTSAIPAGGQLRATDTQFWTYAS